jgi:hypothetical protein
MKNHLPKSITLLFCSLMMFETYGQRFIWSPDSISTAEPNFGIDRYHDVLRFHDPFMYITFPVVTPVVQRKVPLENGEGKSGYWLEGNLPIVSLFIKENIIRPLSSSVNDLHLMLQLPNALHVTTPALFG